MKVLTSSQIREADNYTINHEPISSIDLMERASIACTAQLLTLFAENDSFSVFCGTGNNGGDGLVIARLLSEVNKDVSVYFVHFSDQCSPDNQINLRRLKTQKNVAIHAIHSADDLSGYNPSDILIDALVGTGLTRPLTGLLKEIVQCINNYNATRVAIDLPSGLFAEENNKDNFEQIVKAHYTLSFQVPKLSFFLPSLYPYVGEWILLDIGLNQDFIGTLDTDYFHIDEHLISTILQKRIPFSHKGTFGHALIIAGSHGKIGAAVLSSKACIKSGAGLVTAFVPKCGYEILQASVPEVMVETSSSKDYLSGYLPNNNYSAIGIGPGIGTSDNILEIVKSALNADKIVLDADALNLLGMHKDLLAALPKSTILTPHVKEFERMFGESSNCFDRLQLQREASQKHSVYIILKGKNSSVSCPDGSVYFNNTGNPGMATAGSGDVLTGIVTGLLCQGYTAFESAILAVHLHGLSGDLAKSVMGEEALSASDLIDNLGKAFLRAHRYE